MRMNIKKKSRKTGKAGKAKMKDKPYNPVLFMKIPVRFSYEPDNAS